MGWGTGTESTVREVWVLLVDWGDDDGYAVRIEIHGVFRTEGDAERSRTACRKQGAVFTKIERHMVEMR